MERWRMRDPFLVVARLQAQEQRRYARSKECRQESAMQALSTVFGGSMSDTTNSEIENWIAWCWDGEDPAPSMPKRCRSAEGFFSAPAWSEDERQPQRIIHHASARRVQVVFDRMPALTRQVLRFEYTQRAAYDQWEKTKETTPEGEREVSVWTGNTRRMMGRLRLKISREQYMTHVDAFKAAVREEFADEVCA